MATAKGGKKSPSKSRKDKTYPIWIGNLHDDVTDELLKQRFVGSGSIVSAKVMKDRRGRSKNFGYVNFASKAHAEWAAKKYSGLDCMGKPMKTKGPDQLGQEGHMKQMTNFRPCTDCAFFMQGKGCKNGDQCSYRHSDVARLSGQVCEAWVEKRCENKFCSKQHPGNLQQNTGALLKQSSSQLSLNLSDSPGSQDYQDFVWDDELLEPYMNLSNSNTQDSTHSSINDGCSRREKLSLSESGSFQFMGSTQSFSELSDDEYLGDSDEEELLSNFKYGMKMDGGGDRPEGIARLTSLNSSMMEEEGEGDSDGDISPDPSPSPRPSSSSGSRRSRQESTPQKPQAQPQTQVVLQPVGLFWDIENCPVPFDKSAFSVANKMRREFFQGKREAEFMCVCDISKERKEVIDDLNKAHVTLVHVNAIAKNAADDKLKHSIRRFANTFLPPATVILVSGDVNFSPELSDLRHVHNITTILLHNAQATAALKVCAHVTIPFNDFLADVEPPQKQEAATPTTVIVRGLPNLEAGKLRQRLSRLADNCGGKVLKVTPKEGTARVLYRSYEYAAK